MYPYVVDFVGSNCTGLSANEINLNTRHIYGTSKGFFSKAIFLCANCRKGDRGVVNQSGFVVSCCNGAAVNSARLRLQHPVAA